MNDYDGIIVLGAPRSGTTLVRRLLNAHPRIACPPETNLLSACSRFLAEEESALGLRIGVLSGLAFSNIGEQVVLERLREFAFTFFREIAAAAGKPRWAEKTAFDVFHIDWIERLTAGRCRFICVVRHGLDVACSMKELSDEMDRYLPELHAFVRQYSSPLEAMAHAWVEANERLLRFASDHADACTMLRYEDLVQEPARVLERTFDFLEEPTDVPMVIEQAFARTADVGLGDWKTYESRGIDTSRVDRSRSLSPDVLRRLAEVINPTLARCGYPAIDLTAVADPEEARRRYRAMKLVRQMTTPAAVKSPTA